MKANTRLLTLLALSFVLQSCVQDTHLKKLTIRVDMNQEEQVQTVALRGNLKPLSWQQNTAMTDSDGDGVYEVQIQLTTASDYLQFKFVKNEDEFELDGQDNRSLKFEYKPETLIYEGIFNQN